MRKIFTALVALVLVLVVVEAAVQHHENSRAAEVETAATAQSPAAAQVAQGPSAPGSQSAFDSTAADRYLAALKTSDDMRNLIRAGRDWEMARIEIVNDTHPSPESLQARLPALTSARDKIAGVAIQDTCAMHAREAYLASVDAHILAYRKKAENQSDWYQAEQSAFGADTGWSMAQRACIKS